MERRLNNTNSGLHNLLWEMEGAKPRKDEHVPLFECFAETEDTDILRKHHYSHKADGNHASIAYNLKTLLLL